MKALPVSLASLSSKVVIINLTKSIILGSLMLCPLYNLVMRDCFMESQSSLLIEYVILTAETASQPLYVTLTADTLSQPLYVALTADTFLSLFMSHSLLTLYFSFFM